jgi:hypothetical protein
MRDGFTAVSPTKNPSFAASIGSLAAGFKLAHIPKPFITRVSSIAMFQL